MKVDSTIPKTKRPTMQTIRTFIRNNQGKIYINIRFNKNFVSLSRTGESWKEAAPDLDTPEKTLGIFGAPFADKNTVQHLDDPNYIGYVIDNCNARFYLAIKRKEEPKIAKHSPGPWAATSGALGEDIQAGKKVIATVYRFANDEGEALRNVKIMSNALNMLQLITAAAEGRDIKVEAKHLLNNINS